MRRTLALMAFLVLTSPAGAARPNIVLVMTDDQGFGDLGCHGNKVIRTPHLDRLHAESVRLTNFHVDPTCSPTRAALMTGRYSSRTGVWHTIAGRSLLRRDEATLADHFQAAGYRTGIFGKWHLGDNYPFRAQDRGWQECLVHGGGGVGQTPDVWGNTYTDDTYLRNGKPQKQKGYCTDVFFAAALDFIHKNRERNFVCYVPTNAPHGPFHVPEKYARPYLKQGVPPARARFYGMIENIDENVGRLMGSLKKWGLEENTIVLFMTDNGTAMGWGGKGQDGFNAGMRGVKGSPYEGGHRVPSFWRWPGHLKGGRDVAELTAHIDALPTLLDLCGVKVKHKLPIDGVSLRPLLAGQGRWADRALFVHSQRVETPVKWRQSAVMTQRWRLVNGKELFDLKNDPGQRADVAAKHAAVVKELRGEYERWWDSISERFKVDCRIVLGSAKESPAVLTAHDWRSETVPWDQVAVKRLPAANGYWAVEVEEAGTYRFTLRHKPGVAKFALRAKTARIMIGKQEVTGRVNPGATGATLELTLKPGPARLQTWLEDKDGTSRGAFYLEVMRTK